MDDYDELIADLVAARPGNQTELLAVLDRRIPLAEQLGLLRAILFGAADAICITDLEGRVLMVNRAACQLARRPMGDLVGRPLQEVIAVHPERYAALQAQLARGVPVQDYEFILQQAEEERVLSISMTPMRASKQGFGLVVHVARDVTARHQLERAVKEWQARARQYLYALHPPEVAEELVAGQLQARHLPVTVVFTDISGFTRLTSREPPADVARALQRYFTAMVAVVYDHQGWVDKFIGDSLMAVFGMPAPHPDQAVRALRASLEMERAMRGLALPWRHKVGLATGPVIAGDWGAAQKPCYTAIGTPVNLASRLAHLARPGEILLCHATHAAAQGDFHYEPLGELDIHGYGSSEVYRLREGLGG
jgi:PAS domain S-box-containing protein